MNDVVPLAKDYEKLKAKLDRGAPHEQKKNLLESLAGHSVRVYVRNGESLAGTLMKVTRFEIMVDAVGEGPLIIMKHAIDMIKEKEP